MTEKEEEKKTKQDQKARRLANLFPSLIIQNIIKNKMYLYQIRSFPSHVTLCPSSSSSSIPSKRIKLPAVPFKELQFHTEDISCLE